MIYVNPKLHPELKRITDWMIIEVGKTKTLNDRSELSACIAYSILDLMIADRHATACRAAQTILSMAPHVDPFVQEARLGMLDPGFAKSLEEHKGEVETIAVILETSDLVKPKNCH